MARPKAPNVVVSKEYISDRREMIESLEKADPKYCFMFQAPEVTPQELKRKKQEIVTEKMYDPEGSSQPLAVKSDPVVRVLRDVWHRELQNETDKSYEAAKGVFEETGRFDGEKVTEGSKVGKNKPKAKR